MVSSGKVIREAEWGPWRFVFNSLVWFWTKISPVQVLFSGDDWGCAGDPISWIACRSNRFKVEMPDLIEIPDCKLLSILALPGDWPRKDSCPQTFDLCWVLFSGNLEVEKNHLYSWQPRWAGHRQLPWFCLRLALGQLAHRNVNSQASNVMRAPLKLFQQPLPKPIMR